MLLSGAISFLKSKVTKFMYFNETNDIFKLYFI